MPYMNNKGADQPANTGSLISTFVVHCLDSILPLVSISEISSCWLVAVAVQAGLSLTWWETPKKVFSWQGSNHILQKLTKNRKAKKRILMSYKMMLDFYGMVLKNESTGEIERAENWKARFKHLNRYGQVNYFEIQINQLQAFRKIEIDNSIPFCKSKYCFWA